MHRIDHATAVANMHGAGKPGFGGGNPTTGTPATRFTPAWANDVQENIIRVIEEAGISLVKGDGDQLYDAISAMIAAGQGPIWTASDTGAANAYTATLSPGPGSYTKMVVILQIANANTGAATFNANGLGVKNIKKYSLGAVVALAAGDLPAGGIAILAYDGTQFILVSAQRGISSVSAGNTTITIGGTAGAPTVALNLGAANIWAGTQSGTEAALVDAATIAWNFILPGAQLASVTLGGNRLLGDPANIQNGTYCSLFVIQPTAGGPYSLAFSSSYTNVSGLSFSSAPNAIDHLVFRANGGKLRLVAFAKNVGV